jgi:alanine-glyoxylate transaminase/serine-glyoxylate transaminase/serine-pyruvate transaminase
MAAFQDRKAPVGSYYSDWTHWLPIMQAYQKREAAYFGTPAVNLIWALDVSLGQILAEGLEARVARHRLLSDAFKAGMRRIGLRQVPVGPDRAATTLTALYYPPNVDASVLKQILAEGAILAGGLLPAIRTQYFRVGHMGAVTASDILTTVGAIERGLVKAGYGFEPGSGLAAAQALLV